MSKWMVYGKKADFKAIGDRFGVDQVVARIARNRGNETEQDFDMYFNKTTDSIHNPALLKDSVKAVDILAKKIKDGR